MELKTFMQGLTATEREGFASAVGSTVGHLKNVMYGYKPCNAELAVAIERESRKFGEHRTVKRWDLTPRWQHIWPELIGIPGAPAAPHSKTQEVHHG